MPKTRLGQLLLPGWLGGVLVLWQYQANGGFSPAGALFVLSVPLGGYFLGDLFLKYVLRDQERFDNLPARLAAGIILADVLLYVAVLTLPCGPGAGWALIFFAALTGWVLARRPPAATAASPGIGAEHVFLFVAPVAITFWCEELLSPVQPDGPVVIIQAWLDVFYHLCEIARFAASRGIGTLSDLHMAGVPSVPYHQASYMLAAALVDATGVSSLTAYAGLLVPLGLLAAALGAYALAAAVFGRWPALAGGLALLLLPDAAQQGGLFNPFLGYNWMLQSAPACGYGLAGAAVAFLLLHEACRTGRYALVAAGYAFVLFTLLHKAQIFFAIAYLALIFPVLFMSAVSWKLRLAALPVLAGIYWAVIAASQALPGVPVIRLDGSGLMIYSDFILHHQADGLLKQCFQALFAQSAASWAWRAAAFALLLVISTFGVYGAVYLAQLRRLRQTEEPRVWLFPLLVGALYLVGATGLALDDRRIGGAEELLHRPFVWAHFIVVLWGGAAAYRRFGGDAAPATGTAKRSLLVVILLLLLVPAGFGIGVQTFSQLGVRHPRLPAGEIAAAAFIRAHSARGDLVQDAGNAASLSLFALCERPAFALATGGVREPAGLPARLQAIKELNTRRDAAPVEAFMKQNAIRWYVLGPGESAAWTGTIGRAPAFEGDGYRVYRF